MRAGLISGAALLGVAVNVAVTWTLAKASPTGPNVEGAAAVVILPTGFQRADLVVSLLIASLMIHSGYGLVKAAARIFLEAAPRGIDPDVMGHTLASHPGVVEIHHLHVWEVTSGFPALSALLGARRDAG